MSTQNRMMEGIGRVGIAVLGACSSMLCILGYYPLVPAFYAGCCLNQRKNVLLYIGIFAGMGWCMPIGAMVKYVFVLLVSGVGIRLYQWANHKCSGWVAGILTGLAVAVMDCSGVAFSTMDTRELMLGVCEGIFVAGATVVIHYLYHMAEELGKAIKPAATEVDVQPSYRSDGRIHALAEAVDELSVAFAAGGGNRAATGHESVELLQQEITGKLCAACDGCAVCWEQKESDLAGRLRNMLQAVIAHHPREVILEQNYVQECPRYSWMVEEAIWAFSRMELNEAWYKRLRENRRMIADQLDAMADVMQDWTKEHTNLDAQSRVLLAKIAYEAKERGLVAEQIHLYEDEHKRKSVTAYVSSKWGGGIPAKNYLRALENATGYTMRLQQGARSIFTKDPVAVTAYEDTAFYVMSAVAAKEQDHSAMSGDNFSLFTLDNGNCHICLSDGMGSGETASRESEMVVELIEKLMEAGFARETAIRMMNSAMVLKGDHDSYSTLDFARIDLYTGALTFTKIGAAASFVRTKKEVECISRASLPAGADSDTIPETTCRKLTDGDFLVMVTDGVLEYLHVRNPEETFADMIREIKTENAGMFADALMEKVLLYTGGQVPDDMTIVVAGIWEK